MVVFIYNLSSLGAPHEFLPQAPKIFHPLLSVNVIFKSLVSLDTYQKNKKSFSFCKNLGNSHSKKGKAAASPAIPTPICNPVDLNSMLLPAKKKNTGISRSPA